MIKAILLAVVTGGNRKTWHLLLPTFRFGSNKIAAVLLKLVFQYLSELFFMWIFIVNFPESTISPQNRFPAPQQGDTMKRRSNSVGAWNTLYRQITFSAYYHQSGLLQIFGKEKFALQANNLMIIGLFIFPLSGDASRMQGSAFSSSAVKLSLCAKGECPESSM